MHREVKYSIEIVPGYSLLNASVYRISILKNEDICRKIHDLIDTSHIHPNSSPCGSPVFVVPKKDKTWSMCIDYLSTKF